MDAASSRLSTQQGAALVALSAAGLWGLSPIYWNILGDVPTLVVFCHRIFWSLVFAVVLLSCTRRLHTALNVFRQPSLFFRLCASSAFIGFNWFLYIWAVTKGHIIESSLGYFTTPLLSALLGVLIFRDRPRPLQVLAILFAAAGVLLQFISHGSVPIIALALACSFAIYGALRKGTKVDAMPGLFVETLVLTPFILAYLVYAAQSTPDVFISSGLSVKGLLAGAGIVTSLPLIWYAFAARRISLVSLGLLQYLSPTLQFFIGLFLYGEALNSGMLLTFGFIWFGLLLYSFESWRSMRTAFRRANAG
jgi:chloramphenicol-sensitive protein RarD